SIARPSHYVALPSFPTRRSSDLAGLEGIDRGFEHVDVELEANLLHFSGLLFTEHLTRAADLEIVHRQVKARTELLHELDRFEPLDRKSTRLNSSHVKISYAVFCL